MIGNNDPPNHPALARQMQDYLRWRNDHRRHPTVLQAQRRERARIRIRIEKDIHWGRPRPKAA
ncbi:integrase [Streptomyces sp. NBC_01318]|uniref:integrase n=1 Tax=Streptomyces sp. NBC_01318 TaxID=2903823 RepID=UPI003FA3B547